MPPRPLLKIGKNCHSVSDISSRSVSVVWENFETLIRHFKEAGYDVRKKTKGTCVYRGLQTGIISTEFILDLGLM
jgi:hypothetical protein